MNILTGNSNIFSVFGHWKKNKLTRTSDESRNPKTSENIEFSFITPNILGTWLSIISKQLGKSFYYWIKVLKKFTDIFVDEVLNLVHGMLFDYLI